MSTGTRVGSVIVAILLLAVGAEMLLGPRGHGGEAMTKTIWPQHSVPDRTSRPPSAQMVLPKDESRGQEEETVRQVHLEPRSAASSSVPAHDNGESVVLSPKEKPNGVDGLSRFRDLRQHAFDEPYATGQYELIGNVLPGEPFTLPDNVGRLTSFRFEPDGSVIRLVIDPETFPEVVAALVALERQEAGK